ncbi:hypothetical protein FGRMN_10585 [Fusarium graminum]|nr:hypothetical protein FGRMN_10585 [Fusarium graminum]
MCHVKIWHRECAVCKEVERVQYMDQQNPHAKCDKCVEIHTKCPDESLRDTNANYRCRSCRAKMTQESLELQIQAMEDRGKIRN